MVRRQLTVLCRFRLGSMAGEPAFDQLRTKEQVGYIVALRSAPFLFSPT